MALFIYCVFFVWFTQTIAKECHAIDENRCIVFHEDLVTYSEAESKCDDEFGRLVIVQPWLFEMIWSKFENGYTSKREEEKRFWIGSYIDERSPEKFAEWNIGEPNNNKSDEQCIETLSRSNLYGENCGKLNKFICEIYRIPAPGVDCDISSLSLPNGYFKDCYEPKVLQHGHSLPYICNDDYKATVSTPKVKCVNGMWKFFGYCQPTCKLPQLSENIIFSSVLKSSYALEEEIELGCRNGVFAKENKLVLNTSIKCIGPNQWTNLNFACIPSDYFFTSNGIYEYGKYNRIEFKDGDPMILKCQKDSNISEKDISYTWIKDYKTLSSNNKENIDFNYAISTTGELKFSGTSHKNEGIYICIKRNTFTYEFLNVTVFRLLQKKLKCSSINQTKSLIVNVKDTVLLICPPHTNTTSFLWDKNGKELGYNEEHHVYIPDGKLLIKNINKDDNCTYSCIVTDKMSSCVHYHHHILSVIPSEEERCGEKIKGIYDSYPWFLSLSWEDEEKPFCYGVLVSKQWIVSAASCFFGIRPIMYPHIHIERVFDGKQFYNDVLPIPSVEKIIIHPEFSKQHFVNNIALIKLSKILLFNENYVPPCLMKKDIEQKITSGQGLCKMLLNGQVLLQNAEEDKKHVPYSLGMILKRNNKCRFFGVEDLKESMFCTQMADNNSIASFETGAPFVTEINEKLYIQGIYNLDEKEENNTKYYYFTQISTFYDWLMF